MTAKVRIASRARRYTAGAVVISLVFATTVFYVAWSSYVVRARTDELSGQASAMAAAAESLSGSGTGSADILEERLLRLQAGLLGVALYLTDESGEVRYASLDSGVGETLPVTALGGPDERGNRTGTRTIDSGKVIVVAAPMQDGWLVAVQPLREARAAQGGILGLLALSLVLAAGVAMAAAWLFARRLAGPLERLRVAAEDVAAGAWGRQVDVEGDDEVASLADSFNRMSRRVAAAYEAQKEFVGNVSHELRTPITAIRGWAGALSDGTAEGGQQRDRALRAITEEADRLSELTEALLALADLDAGVVPVGREVVHVQRLFEAVVDRHAQRAGAAGLSLSARDATAGAAVSGDRERLLQAVSSLVENAIAYTPAGGTVELSAELLEDRVAIRVEDSGPGIPEEARDAVFERFARLDRSRSQGSGGSGLGLAICKRLVELQGGVISAGESGLGGARFEIVLPLHAQSGAVGA